MKSLLRKLLIFLTFIHLVKIILDTSKTQTPVKLKMWFIQKVLGFNKSAYWPMHHSSLVSSPNNILAGIETSPGYMPGCYIQGLGGITVGDYTQISCNVGIISKNHDPHDCRIHTEEKFPSVNIGSYCWIGMNSTILPNVTLGDFVVVGAGSVVTKSFPEGKCIIAGNPAIIIKKLNENKCAIYSSEKEYYGYISKSDFSTFRKKNLKL